MPTRTAAAPRAALAFRAVNRTTQPGFRPDLQRHHLLPRQLLARPCFVPLIRHLGRDRIGFDDFRCNGMLLPASDTAALRLGLPLHRGPHRTYNELVFERVGEIEAHWAAVRPRRPELALSEALSELALLQQALRQRLLSERHPLQLNRRDPHRPAQDFAVLDAMAARLWAAT
jgi:A nuclease family of the HNH/ENDO VII superfamily with conserved AHH